MGLLSGLMGNASQKNVDKVERDLEDILVPGEQVTLAFSLIRDLIVFTEFRLILVDKQQTDSKISDYVKGYSQMKPKEAAAIFDTMTDNLNLVAQILENMDAQSRADILGKMNSDTAAKVTEIMNPSE